ncbi:hypothetical protein AURDEDRAFT_172219 [Auricularia subglabra TFB-10046 SS5]|nr:hypothetical protein AURDEDRAFT_172219 [Auricularia subglabra TFB-10046 SS5]
MPDRDHVVSRRHPHADVGPADACGVALYQHHTMTADDAAHIRGQKDDKHSTLFDMPGRDHAIPRCSYTQRDDNSTDACGVARYHHHHATIAAGNAPHNEKTGSHDSPYALMTPQLLGRRSRTTDPSGSPWAAGTNLGPDASEYETWGQAPLSTNSLRHRAARAE